MPPEPRVESTSYGPSWLPRASRTGRAYPPDTEPAKYTRARRLRLEAGEGLTKEADSRHCVPDAVAEVVRDRRRPGRRGAPLVEDAEDSRGERLLERVAVLIGVATHCRRECLRPVGGGAGPHRHQDIGLEFGSLIDGAAQPLHVAHCIGEQGAAAVVAH